MSDNLSASEAVYGLMAWLTTRAIPVTFGAKHDAAKAAELAKAFCKANDFAEPRDGWTDSLKHPEK